MHITEAIHIHCMRPMNITQGGWVGVKGIDAERNGVQKSAFSLLNQSQIFQPDIGSLQVVPDNEGKNFTLRRTHRCQERGRVGVKILASNGH